MNPAGASAARLQQQQQSDLGGALFGMLLGNMPLRSFLDDHYLQRPLCQQGNAMPLVSLGSARVVDDLTENTSCDLVVIRDGKPGDQRRPCTREEVQRLGQLGFSLIFRHTERHDADLALLAGAMAQTLHGAIDLHLYCTPAGYHSFGWHYDAEEVFIIQTDGDKEYQLRANTVHPDPLLMAMPTDMAFERERSPVMTYRLHPGDWLYIPGGWWHVAKAHEPSRSLSIGIMPVTPIELLQAACAELARDPLHRRRVSPSAPLGTTPPPAHVAAPYRSALAQAIRAVQALEDGPDDLVTRFLDHRGRYVADLLRRGSGSRRYEV